MDNIKNDFLKFIKSNGASSGTMDMLQNALTPYILEETELRATQIDIFSRLMKEKIIWVSGEVNQHMSDILQSQLLYLDKHIADGTDITMYINSPGGSVMNGLGIYDTMNFIESDVVTVNIGMCASMGSVLLSSGAKGKRGSLIHSKVMVHAVSHGTQGNIHATRISQLEAEKYNFILMKILAENTGRTFDELLEASSHDKWFNSDEAKEYGLIDTVIFNEGSMSITDRMEGFEDYYIKKVLNKKQVFHTQ